MPSASRADPVSERRSGRGSAADSVPIAKPDLTGAPAPVLETRPGVTSVSESVSEAGPVVPKVSQDRAYLIVNGSDFPLEGSRRLATGFGHRPKLGDSDLAELSRRSGIPKEKLREAFGTIKQYRITDGLLQRSTFMRPAGSYEFLTVIPEGGWRRIESGGAVRRISLRRHVIHTFNLTPM